MQVIKRSDRGVRLARQHPVLRNAQIIGAGTFALVFDDGDDTSVLKLTADKYGYMYLCDGVYAPEKDFAPVVYEDFYDVGETSEGDTLYLIRVERLRPLAPATPARKLATKIVRTLGRHQTIAALRKVELPPGMVSFVDDLERFMTNTGDSSLDIGYGNFMTRDDGTLIFNDPVVDCERLMQLSKQRRACANYY